MTNYSRFIMSGWSTKYLAITYWLERQRILLYEFPANALSDERKPKFNILYPIVYAERHLARTSHGGAYQEVVVQSYFYPKSVQVLKSWVNSPANQQEEEKWLTVKHVPNLTCVQERTLSPPNEYWYHWNVRSVAFLIEHCKAVSAFRHEPFTRQMTTWNYKPELGRNILGVFLHIK